MLVVILLWCVCDHGVSGVDTERLSVMEGESISLNTGVEKNQQEKISWYFTFVNDILIAEITGDQSKICTDVQCGKRFRDRLKLDNQTGSLTIKGTRTTESGVYKLKLNSRSTKIFSLAVHSFFGADTEEVSVFVMEGDSVTLNTGVQTNQQEKIRWYFYETRIAQIIGDFSNICTDVQCNNGTERYKDRLKLDHQTGSLTITNIIISDSGLYQLKIFTSSSLVTKIFIVAVYDVSAAEREEMKIKSVNEGESVTLYPAVTKNTNDVMKWYFNEILITEITGDQSKICTDDQCDERFRDRLKLDHQTGSLTIMNIRNTDSGEYLLQMIINNSSFSITRVKSFSVSVTAVSDSSVSSGGKGGNVVAVIVCVALLVSAVAGVFYLHHRKSKQTGQSGTLTQNSPDQRKHTCVEDSIPFTEKESIDP